MKKAKRVLALIGAVLLIFLYAGTMLLAIFGNEHTRGWLMASIVMTVVIPVLLYAISLIARVFSGKNQEDAYRRAEAEAGADSAGAAGKAADADITGSGKHSKSQEPGGTS